MTGIAPAPTFAIGKVGGALLADGRWVEFIAIGKPMGDGVIGVWLPRKWNRDDMLRRLIESGMDSISDSARDGNAFIARFRAA